MLTLDEISRCWAIIDCMFNVPLLYWVSGEAGDPRFVEIAQAIADTVARNFAREDGSVRPDSGGSSYLYWCAGVSGTSGTRGNHGNICPSRRSGHKGQRNLDSQRPAGLRRRDGADEGGDMMRNPILPGFHPDASAVQVGGDYYIATSTFEWWPGIDIYHSRDLVNWEWCAAPISKPEQVPSGLMGNYNSGSLWAPHLSWSDGLFWLVYTDVKSATAFKDTLNYVITAPAIQGPWSKPSLVTASGFDPALFHDDDGRHYFLNMLFDWRLDRPGFAGTVIQEFDPITRTLIGERKHFYKGTSLGVCEGPQILKKDGYYYLLCAAGGTGYMHAATVARAKSLDGPWEDSPYFPLLTARDDPANPLQKSGHACFLEKDGEWYITHICARPLTQRGNCTLGRETSLQKIEWVDGWPRLVNGTCYPDIELDIPGGVAQRRDYSETVEFFPDTSLPPSFKTLRGPLEPERDYSLTARPGWLRLYGGQSLSSHHRQTLFARRWQSFHFTASVTLDFAPQNFQQTAGLILFYDTCNWIYALATYNEDIQRRTVQILRCDNNDFSYGSEETALPEGPVELRVEVDRDKAWFSCRAEEAEWKLLGDVQPADHLSDDYVETRRGRCAFTGAMVGICAQDMDAHRSYADFSDFSYEESF